MRPPRLRRVFGFRKRRLPTKHAKQTKGELTEHAKCPLKFRFFRVFSGQNPLFVSIRVHS
jgi:hypothetical protein